MEAESRWHHLSSRLIPKRLHLAAGHWVNFSNTTSTDHVLWSAARVSTIVWASVTLMYLLTLTADYYWDGITFALQIEKIAKGDSYIALLFHQNHLLYNSIGFLLYKAFQILGIAVRAITLLQILNAIVGGLAVAVFFRLAERVTCNRYVALVCAAALAVCAAWWKISTDADAYILASLFVLIAAYNLLGENPRWFVAGTSLAGAMLIHQMASLFFPAALLAIYFSTGIKHRLRFAIGMSALAWIITLSAYYTCAVLLLDATRPGDVIKWALSNPTQKSLASSPLSGLFLLPKLNIDAIVGHNFSVFRSQGGLFELTAVFASLIAAFVFVLRISRSLEVGRALRTLRTTVSLRKEPWVRNVLVLVTWITTYALFLIFWGPLIYFRALYAPAIVLCCGLALANYHRLTDTKPSGAAGFAVAALALFNLGFYIGPNLRSDANVMVSAAERARTQWAGKTVIFFADRNEADTAFEYFNQETSWQKLNPASVDALSEGIAKIHKEGGEVWLNRGAIKLVGEDRLDDYDIPDEITVDAPNSPAHYVQVQPIE